MNDELKSCLPLIHHSAFIVHTFLTVLFTTKMQDQKAVAVIAQDRRAFDGAREAQRLLETAVGDFELMITDALTEKSVAPTTRNTERLILNYYFKVVGAHPRQINLHNPSVRSLINIRIGTPHTRARTRTTPDMQHPKIAFD
jgi:hypothetical protein